MQELAQSVLEYLRRHNLIKAGDRVGLAVSGGADSLALLRVFLDLRRELGIVLSVVHFNHKLRGTDSDADEQFVAALARTHSLEFYVASDDVKAYASEKHLSIETAARQKRYEYFLRLLREDRMNHIATAHTLDDQAETVLLKAVRGAGTRGLAGIYPQLLVGTSPSAATRPAIIRPLLGVRRTALEAYLSGLHQPWREDQSNRDLRHARNRVRHGILPRLEHNLNPEVKQALAETAEIARAEEQYLAAQVNQILPQVLSAEKANSLDFVTLMAHPLALQRRIVRAAAEAIGLRLEFRHVEQLLGLAPGGAVVLPGNCRASRIADQLQFAVFAAASASQDYEYTLSVPGQVQVLEIGSRFEAVLVSGSPAEGYNRQNLFDVALIDKELRIRNWRPGDRYWPAHTKAPKKVKELLQERHVTGAERKTWPVVLSESEIVWLRGFPAPASLAPQNATDQALVIREIPL